MKVRGDLLSLTAYVFQNPDSPCNYRVWEEKIKHQFFGLMCKDGRLLVFCGHFLVVFDLLLVVCGSLWSSVFVCWCFGIFCPRLWWYVVVACS